MEGTIRGVGVATGGVPPPEAIGGVVARVTPNGRKVVAAVEGPMGMNAGAGASVGAEAEPSGVVGITGVVADRP